MVAIEVAARRVALEDLTEIARGHPAFVLVIMLRLFQEGSH